MKFDPFKKKTSLENRDTASEQPEQPLTAAEKRPADVLSDEPTPSGYELPEADFSVLDPDAGKDVNAGSTDENAAGHDGGNPEDSHGLKKNPVRRPLPPALRDLPPSA